MVEMFNFILRFYNVLDLNNFVPAINFSVWENRNIALYTGGYKIMRDTVPSNHWKTLIIIHMKMVPKTPLSSTPRKKVGAGTNFTICTLINYILAQTKYGRIKVQFV